MSYITLFKATFSSHVSALWGCTRKQKSARVG